jgi:pimeloyl-ACP methyl ester carboxylesterase
MQSRFIHTPDGIRLHAVEAGNPSGPAVLFIHGVSQSAAAWRRQLESPLLKDFRMVAIDIRGHGRSDKPAGGYDNPKTWADDVNAVIQSLGLRGCVLVGWSYAGFIIGDYVRFYGQHDVSAINFVGVATRINEQSAPDVLGGGFLSLFPGLFSSDVGESVATLEAFARLCTSREMEPDELYLTVGYNALVPPTVRAQMFARDINNDEALAELSVPVLVTQGEQDRIVHPHVARGLVEMIPPARMSMYAEAGHAVFLDDAERFNTELAECVRSAIGMAAR